MNNFQPWFEIIGVIGGSIIGAYLAVRVTLARMEEKLKAHDKQLDDHGERINRLEGVHFSKGAR